MSLPQKRSVQLLAAARTALDRAQSNPELRDALAMFGMPNDQIAAGQRLRDAVLALREQQQTAYGALKSANITYRRSYNQAMRDYMAHVKLARLALDDKPGALHDLGLVGERARAQNAWLLQARQLYNVALASPEIMETLARFGIARADLEEGLEQIARLESLDSMRRRAQEAAQDSTRQRDEALGALADWLHDFRLFERAALRMWRQSQARPALTAMPTVALTTTVYQSTTNGKVKAGS